MNRRVDDSEETDSRQLRAHPWLNIKSFITWILTTVIAVCTICGFAISAVSNYAYPRLKGEGLEKTVTENFGLVRNDLARIDRKIDKL